MMTLEGLIERYAAIAERDEKVAKDCESDIPEWADVARENAADYRQIVEWLTDYKRLKETCNQSEIPTDSDLISRQAAMTLPVMPKEHREYQTLNLDDAYDQGWFDLQKRIENLPPAQQWIPCKDRLPYSEQEVLICTKKRLVGKDAYIDSIITPAIYEDGTTRENDSKWNWIDIDYEEWDEEEDCGIIPEGWWENRHFNPDEVYNSIVDQEVVAWMPLPPAYEEDEA